MCVLSCVVYVVSLMKRCHEEGEGEGKKEEEKNIKEKSIVQAEADARVEMMFAQLCLQLLCPCHTQTHRDGHTR